MAKRCKITVVYLNGTVEEYFGGLHADERLLRIWPKDSPRKTVNIPIRCIRHYITEDQEVSKCGT